MAKMVDFAKLSFSAKDLNWIHRYPLSYKPNLFLNECNQDVAEEMAFFKSSGGGTVVENTTEGICPDPKFLYEVSKSSGVNIVSGTGKSIMLSPLPTSATIFNPILACLGYYLACSQPQDNLKLSVEAMSKYMTDNLIIGEVVETSDGPQSVKSGCIGEVGCSWPLHGSCGQIEYVFLLYFAFHVRLLRLDFEKKSLQASAMVQSELDCPVIIHPGRTDEAPFEIMRVFLEAGGKAGRTVMSHLDRMLTMFICSWHFRVITTSFFVDRDDTRLWSAGRFRRYWLLQRV